MEYKEYYFIVIVIRSRGSDISLLERVEALETAKMRLKAELAEARAQLIQNATPTHQDMSTSISLIDT